MKYETLNKIKELYKSGQVEILDVHSIIAAVLFTTEIIQSDPEMLKKFKTEYGTAAVKIIWNK